MRLSVASLRRVVKGDLRIEFVRQELTSYGGLELLRRYLRQIDVKTRLHAACAAVGSDYGGARLGLLIVSLFYVGARRLEQLRYLAGDPHCVDAGAPVGAGCFQGTIRIGPAPRD